MTTTVGVDATCWLNRRGFGRFARNVVTRLVEREPQTRFVLYVDEATAAQAELPEGAVERLVPLSETPTEAAAAGSSRRLRDLLRLTRAVRADRPDAFFFPSVYTYFPVPGVPAVVGVHDAIADELPELTLPTRRERLVWNAKEQLAIRTAAAVFTVSDASRQALVLALRARPRRARRRARGAGRGLLAAAARGDRRGSRRDRARSRRPVLRLRRRRQPAQERRDAGPRVCTSPCTARAGAAARRRRRPDARLVPLVGRVRPRARADARPRERRPAPRLRLRRRRWRRCTAARPRS